MKSSYAIGCETASDTNENHRTPGIVDNNSSGGELDFYVRSNTD